jgi:hypothetical protein
VTSFASGTKGIAKRFIADYLFANSVPVVEIAPPYTAM